MSKMKAIDRAANRWGVAGCFDNHAQRVRANFGTLIKRHTFLGKKMTSNEDLTVGVVPEMDNPIVPPPS